MDRVLTPTSRLCGKVTVPGDKSISHRALLFSAIAEGRARLTGLSPGADVASTVACLRALGVALELKGTQAQVEGRGLFGLKPPARELDAGNAGTLMRLLLGLLAGQRFESVLVGDPSLSRRPMDRVIVPLRQMGAEIAARQDRFAPLRVRGRPLQGIDYALPVASAQVQSALLLAGLHARGATCVREPAPVRDHSERLLAYLGAQIAREDGAVILRPGRALRARDLEVPGDPSAAAFWLAAGALVPESEITLEDVGVNPTRTGFLEVLEAMGATVQRTEERRVCAEPRATLRVRGASLRAVELGGALVPRLIDELPLVAVLATQARGTTVVRDAAELRVKETDRLRAVAENLRRMGARIETRPDGWRVSGPQPLRGAVLDSFGDHRIAMAFAVAALIARGPTTIRNADWVEISYPGFFEVLDALRR